MAKKQNTILHRWFKEVWNNSRAKRIDEMIAPNAVARGLEDSRASRIMNTADRKNSRNSITVFVARFGMFTALLKKWFNKLTVVIVYCKIKA